MLEKNQCIVPGGVIFERVYRGERYTYRVLDMRTLKDAPLMTVSLVGAVTEDEKNLCVSVLRDCLQECNDSCRDDGLDSECRIAFYDCIGNPDNYRNYYAGGDSGGVPV